MTKYIFVDLDECLLHCRPLGGDRGEAEMVLKSGEVLINAKDLSDPQDFDDFYGSRLRPGAINFLDELRKIPDRRLSVLTSSVGSYANANNKAHGLGFDPTEIYSREDLQSGSLDPDRFGSGPVYLIDNLPPDRRRVHPYHLSCVNGSWYLVALNLVIGAGRRRDSFMPGKATDGGGSSIRREVYLSIKPSGRSSRCARISLARPIFITFKEYYIYGIYRAITAR